MVTFKEQGLNAVMQVLFAVKASLSWAVCATIVRVPYCVRPQGTNHHPPSRATISTITVTVTAPLPSLAWKIPHEPLLWCKSQVGEMWARPMHRHCAVKSLLTLPTGDSRKRHRARAGREEESDKEGMGAKEREMWGDEHFRESLLTFVLFDSLSRLCLRDDGLNSVGCTLSSPVSHWDLTCLMIFLLLSFMGLIQRNYLFLLVLKKKEVLIQPPDLSALIPSRLNLFSYFSLGNLLADKDWFFPGSGCFVMW